MFKTPIVWRRNAKGSWDPVGISPRLKEPVMVSNLSARLSKRPKVVCGNSSPAKRGKYCSKTASAVSGSSPSRSAYSRPITPWSSVNSWTICVNKSVLAKSARCLISPSSTGKSNLAVKKVIIAARRWDLSNNVPNPSWKTIRFKSSVLSAKDFLRSSAKKNLASSKRARKTRSLPWRTVSKW